jgi:NTF2 fold immunity protein
MLTRNTCRALVTAVILVVASVPSGAQAMRKRSYTLPDKRTYMPPAGYVPDAETAIRIAVAVWEPIYGRKHIQGQRPFRATLHGGVWTVTGSLPRGAVGGTAEADISKRDGSVLRVTHGK